MSVAKIDWYVFLKMIQEEREKGLAKLEYVPASLSFQSSISNDKLRREILCMGVNAKFSTRDYPDSQFGVSLVEYERLLSEDGHYEEYLSVAKYVDTLLNLLPEKDQEEIWRQFAKVIPDPESFAKIRLEYYTRWFFTSIDELVAWNNPDRKSVEKKRFYPEPSEGGGEPSEIMDPFAVANEGPTYVDGMRVSYWLRSGEGVPKRQMLADGGVFLPNVEKNEAWEKAGHKLKDHLSLAREAIKAHEVDRSLLLPFLDSETAKEWVKKASDVQMSILKKVLDDEQRYTAECRAERAEVIRSFDEFERLYSELSGEVENAKKCIQATWSVSTGKYSPPPEPVFVMYRQACLDEVRAWCKQVCQEVSDFLAKYGVALAPTKESSQGHDVAWYTQIPDFMSLKDVAAKHVGVAPGEGVGLRGSRGGFVLGEKPVLVLYMDVGRGGKRHSIEVTTVHGLEVLDTHYARSGSVTFVARIDEPNWRVEWYKCTDGYRVGNVMSADYAGIHAKDSDGSYVTPWKIVQKS